MLIHSAAQRYHRQQTNDPVAQVSNLPYRRFAIGKPCASPLACLRIQRVRRLEAAIQQVGNLRHALSAPPSRCLLLRAKCNETNGPPSYIGICTEPIHEAQMERGRLVRANSIQPKHADEASALLHELALAFVGLWTHSSHFTPDGGS